MEPVPAATEESLSKRPRPWRKIFGTAASIPGSAEVPDDFESAFKAAKSGGAEALISDLEPTVLVLTEHGS